MINTKYSNFINHITNILVLEYKKKVVNLFFLSMDQSDP